MSDERSFRNLLNPTAAAIIGLSLVFAASQVQAADPHTSGTKGQPNQSCGSATAMSRPGNAVSAPGSAFNPSGHSGTVYAGQQTQNSKNPKSVAQYDVACFQVSHH